MSESKGRIPPGIPVADTAPGRYVKRVDRWTGEELPGELEPADLLVTAYRDRHPVDVLGRVAASAIVRFTGDEERAFSTMKRLRWFGRRAAGSLVRGVGRGDPDRVARVLFGLRPARQQFQFRTSDLTDDFIETRLDGLRAEAVAIAGRAAVDGAWVRPLLTGGTGFIGKEVIAQAAADPEVAEMIVLVREKTVTDRHTGEIVEVLSPEMRGKALLAELSIDDSVRPKFRFLDGDIEKPNLGLSTEDHEYVASVATHVVHCAASVSFDDPYLDSFRANVVGSQNALEFSLGLQELDGSPFVAHLGIETSFIHGRQVARAGSEFRLEFPHDNYNNYYELTKAIGSQETERFMIDRGLRVAQLCPAIVIGDAATGNNRGDTKVINAPVNAWGRIIEAAPGPGDPLTTRLQAKAIAALGIRLPADRTATLNLVSVDRVGAGILAALRTPEVVGRRVHLANKNLFPAERLMAVASEELGVKVPAIDPTLQRVLLMPLATRALRLTGQARMARALGRLANVFGGYMEFGQPVAMVGADTELLGLDPEHPDPAVMFRMLCRHNRFVQRFGAIRAGEELAEREARWARFLSDYQETNGNPAVDLTPRDFARLAEAAGF